MNTPTYDIKTLSISITPSRVEGGPLVLGCTLSWIVCMCTSMGIEISTRMQMSMDMSIGTSMYDHKHEDEYQKAQCGKIETEGGAAYSIL